MYTNPKSLGNKVGYFFAGVMLLVLIMGFGVSSARASNFATATKDCSLGPPCTTTATPMQFTINSQQTVTWTANYLGAPPQGNGFYIAHVGAPLNEIPLVTGMVSGGSYSGTQLLGAGTYAISINYFGMGPGNYSINYDRTASIQVLPATHVFPIQHVGTSSAPLTFTISKTGDWDVMITGVVSSDPAHFAVSGAPVGQVVGPNRSFQVTYVAGAVVGSFAATITVSGTSVVGVTPVIVTGGNPSLMGSTGDPHITTGDGIDYDLQGAGEFVALRDVDDLQIQTRQAPVATASVVGPNPHTGLTTCVSINTAVAARVGKQRVTIQPNISGRPDPSGLQLRVDGTLTKIGANGLNLASGGRVVKSAVGEGFEIDFPNGTALIVTAVYWTSLSTWYLDVQVFRAPSMEGIIGGDAPGSSRTRTPEGIMGVLAPDSWLPALPDGTSLGPRPGPLHQRYVDLYQKFAEAWRVTDKTSLFDYAPGTSTDTFTQRSWPPENPPCVIPGNQPAKPLDPGVARRLCRNVADENMNANCVFDVTVTGEPGFAKLYELSQRIRVGSTTTTLDDSKDSREARESATFTATVAPRISSDRSTPTGTVQFILDGYKVGQPVRLDSNGRATWKTSRLKVGNHKVAASYLPRARSRYLPSSSLERPYAVTDDDRDRPNKNP